jgi:hypothetical protein
MESNPLVLTSGCLDSEVVFWAFSRPGAEQRPTAFWRSADNHMMLLP